MKHYAHVQIVGRHEGRRPAYDAWVDGAEAIVRCEEPQRPLGDPRSAFYGGQGLRPPFCPGVHHEARVWAHVEPTRAIAHGIGPEGPYVALRRLPGLTLTALAPAMPFDAACIEAVVAHVATELAALHSVGVLHRDLRPGTVLLVEGRARLAGLAAARLHGAGPPLARGPGTEADDVAALGGIVTWMLAGRPAAALLSGRLADVVAALQAPEPRARPRSANEVLGALGEPPGPEADIAPPHPALVAWGAGAWSERLVAQGNVWDVVRQADAANLDRWALAGVASRLLAADRGTDGWLALGTLCWMLAERATGTDRDAYRAQVEEARARAGAPWHPSAVALTTLLAGGERVGPLCDTQQLGRAEACARRDGGGGLAVVGWRVGDEALVDEGLAEAGQEDLDAVRVAASRLLVTAPRDAPISAVRLAFPEAQLEAVRRLCAAGADADAARLADACVEPWGARARLIVALSGGEKSEALGIARVLAVRGAWDATVAAALLVYAPDGDPLRVQARRVLQGLAPREDLAGLRLRGVQAVAADTHDVVGWAALVCARVHGGEVSRAATELERASPAATAWSLFALELFAAGRLEDARVVLLEAVRRHPDDASLATVEASLALLDGDPEVARRAAEHAIAQDPASPWAWLARAACATWTGDADLARQDLSAAARAGAHGRAFEALEACVPPALD